jgi:hypothetical protein
VNTEDPSACVTVNCKVYRSARVLLLSVVPNNVYKVSIKPIIQYKTCLTSHAQTRTHDNKNMFIVPQDHLQCPSD